MAQNTGKKKDGDFMLAIKTAIDEKPLNYIC